MGTDERPVKILSCASCRARKIKCSKVQPRCLECERVDLQCVYPSRRPTRRAPRPHQKELLERISRLESIVGQVDKDQKPKPGDSIDDAVSVAELLKTSTNHNVDSNARPTGRLDAVPEPAARYMSSEFWGNLVDEVEAIRQALEQTSSEDEESVTHGISPSSNSNPAGAQNTPSGYLLGNPSYHERESLHHPKLEVAMRLWQLYCRNCDPLIKILHRPTMEVELRAVVQSGSASTTPPPLTALVFSIYFAAVASLSPEDCEREFGEPLDILSGRYRILAERALAAADYLNANDLRALQAFTIYVCMTRCQSHGRTSWALVSLLVRLAQAMHLHRDGEGRRFSPFEAEMRRRLWGFIVVLDIRASEDRGTDNIILANTFDTIPPTLIDDADFSPSSTGPLIPKANATDNIVPVCMHTCSSVFGLILHQPPKLNEQPQPDAYTEDMLLDQVRRLETNYIHAADHNNILSLYASEIARIVILKLWLACQYPFGAQPPIIRPNVSRETMLRTALSVMELSERMELPPWRGRFSWWTGTYVQWHPLAVALAELCVRTEGELVERAWKVVERVYPWWRGKIADTARGTLWRPIKKLMSRAKAARQAATSGLPSSEPSQPQPTTRESQVEDFPAPIIEPVLYQPPAQMDVMVDDAASVNMDTAAFPIQSNLINLYYDEPGFADQDMDFTLWNEFLMETQFHESPEGSGNSG